VSHSPADTSALVKLVVREADELAGVLTYGHRMADAARSRGVAVIAQAEPRAQCSGAVARSSPLSSKTQKSRPSTGTETL
jgi:hypothetical protein